MKTHNLKKIVSGALIVALTIVFMSGNVLKRLENVAYASDPYPPGPVVFAFYDPKETMVYPGTWAVKEDEKLGNANYPEVAYITFVALQYNGPDLGWDFYRGDEWIFIKIDIPQSLRAVADRGEYIPPFQIELEYGEFLLSNIWDAFLDDLFGLGYVNWRGFYYAIWGEGMQRLEEFLDNINTTDGTNAPCNPCTIFFNLNHHLNVVAVKNWNWQKEFGKLPLVIDHTIPSPCPGPPREVPIVFMINAGTLRSPNYIPIPGGGFDIELNIDNVSLDREHIRHHEREGGGIDDLVPGPGEHYTGDPGRFVVDGTINPATQKGRTYNNIIEIMIDVEKGLIDRYTDEVLENLPRDEQIDWLQVAAADIYNLGIRGCNSDVFKCVWEIEVKELGKGRTLRGEEFLLLGRIFTKYPYRVYLNPYVKKMRFNKPGNSTYGFHTYAKRDGVIYHESLHCYHMLPGAFVDDEEDGNERYNDWLYVKNCTERNSYLKFSYDDRKRGFLRPNRNAAGSLTLLRYLDGLSGDGYHHYSGSGTFVIRIDDKLTKNELKKIFVDGEGIDRKIATDIPNDLPSIWKSSIHRNRLCIYRQSIFAGGYFEIYSGRSDWIKLKEDYTIPAEVDSEHRLHTEYGYYKPKKYSFKINGFESYGGWPSGQKCYDLITSSLFPHKLYVIYEIYHDHKPYEYDANYFESITRGPRGD